MQLYSEAIRDHLRKHPINLDVETVPMKPTPLSSQREKVSGTHIYSIIEPDNLDDLADGQIRHMGRDPQDLEPHDRAA